MTLFSPTTYKHLLFFKVILTYLFLVALGVQCCAPAFSNCGEAGLLFVEIRGFLIAVVSLVGEYRF